MVAIGGELAPAGRGELKARQDMSLTYRLREEKRELTERLEKVNCLIGKLDKSPETTEIIDAIFKMYPHY